MYTTCHFQSASEINNDIFEAIKIAFKDKSVVITVEEEQKEGLSDIPEWQKEIVRNRRDFYKNNPQELLDWYDAQKGIKLCYW